MTLMACSAPEVPVPAPATMPLIIDVPGFEGWLRAAHPGSRITYHRGHLCVDRQQKHHAPHDPARDELNRLADRAMRASEQGLVHLVQQRRGDADYSYLAIRTRTPAKRRRVSRLSSNPWRTA